MITSAGTGHIDGDFSAADIVATEASGGHVDQLGRGGLKVPDVSALRAAQG